MAQLMISLGIIALCCLFLTINAQMRDDSNLFHNQPPPHYTGNRRKGLPHFNGPQGGPAHQPGKWGPNGPSADGVGGPERSPYGYEELKRPPVSSDGRPYRSSQYEGLRGSPAYVDGRPDSSFQGYGELRGPKTPGNRDQSGLKPSSNNRQRGIPLKSDHGLRGPPAYGDGRPYRSQQGYEGLRGPKTPDNSDQSGLKLLSNNRQRGTPLTNYHGLSGTLQSRNRRLKRPSHTQDSGSRRSLKDNDKTTQFPYLLSNDTVIRMFSVEKSKNEEEELKSQVSRLPKHQAHAQDTKVTPQENWQNNIVPDATKNEDGKNKSDGEHSVSGSINKRKQ